jgi:hypothetical protein
LLDAAFAFSTTQARLVAECDRSFAASLGQAAVEIGITKRRAAVSEAYQAALRIKARTASGGLAILRGEGRLLNSDDQLALQSGFLSASVIVAFAVQIL